MLDNISRPQFRELRTRVLPKLGFVNIFHQPGYEADDLIASLINNCHERYMVVSRDGDLYQLLNHCDIYDIQTKTIMTREVFMKEWNVIPDDWCRVKAIAGCSTDHIPGIRGVGERTACKFIKGEMNNNHKIYQSIVSEEGKDIIQRNLKLVTIPFSGTLPLIADKQPAIKHNNFIDVCQEYGFKSFITTDMFDKWKKHFGLDN